GCSGTSKWRWRGRTARASRRTTSRVCGWRRTMTERALRPSGFTLLELTLALASLALLAAICYGAFHLSWRAVQRGEAAVVRAQGLRVAIDVFIRQIKSVAVYEVPTEDDEPVSYFYGEPTWMKFVTTAGLAQGGGLTRVVYRLENDPPRLIV